MVMSQIKKVESEKKDSDAEDGEGSKEEKKPQRSYSGNFFEERARRQEFSQRRRQRTQMLFTVRIVMEKLCH